MESEKVKKIKKVIEMFAIDNKEMTLFQSPVPQGESCEITIKYADILTLINDLERANERLLNKKWDKEDDLDNYHEENQKLKDRIAELEEYIKGNQADAKAFVENWHSDLKKELINFAERLKEKATILNSLTYDHRSLSFPETKILDFDDIDETLQECLND